MVKNCLEAASLNNVSLRSEDEDRDVTEPHSDSKEKATAMESGPGEGGEEEGEGEKWTDIDLAESHDPLFSSEYVQRYMPT